MDNPDLDPLVLAGYGDIGARVARQIGSGRPMRAINRSGRAARLSQPPEMIRGELAEAGGVLRDGDTLLWLAPPPRDGLLESNLQQMLKNAPALKKMIYLSTSGVYGDCGGRWVDESADINPSTDRARRRVSAETLVQDFGAERGISWVIVRVPGIYGPGRLPRARLEKRLPVLAESLSPWSNRVHAEDLAAALVQFVDLGSGIYNLSDGHPGTITQYFHAAADVLGVPRLPEVSDATELTPELSSYMAESRRLKTERLQQELGFRPRWPDFRQALEGCIYDDLSWELDDNTH